jgi:hypothetical protein
MASRQPIVIPNNGVTNLTGKLFQTPLDNSNHSSLWKEGRNPPVTLSPVHRPYCTMDGKGDFKHATVYCSVKTSHIDIVREKVDFSYTRQLSE